MASLATGAPVRVQLDEPAKCCRQMRVKKCREREGRIITFAVERVARSNAGGGNSRGKETGDSDDANEELHV